MKNLVYLAGPITGCSYEGCTSWREYACEKLALDGITGVSPMRCKEYLSKEKEVQDSYDNTALSSSKGIMTRDRWDVTRCDVLLANLNGATKVSIGTVMEIAWADLARKPIILIMNKGNIHEHSMICEAAGFIVQDIYLGLEMVKALLK